MRISDWSSDVCSSDLLQESARRDAAGKTRLGVPVLGLEAEDVVDIEYEIEVGVIVVLVVHSLRGFGEHAPRIEARHVAESRIAYRTEERRVGKEWVSTCRSRWTAYH